MIIIIIIHFLSIITNSQGQKNNYCTPQNPFRIYNGECTTFENVCYKKNDPQCDELQNACKYCPPNNITLITLKNILNINQNNSLLISDALKYSNKSVNLLEERSSALQYILKINQNNSQLTSMEIKSIVEKGNKISIFVLILIIISIILNSVFAFLLNEKYGLFGASVQDSSLLLRFPRTRVDPEQRSQLLPVDREQRSQLLSVDREQRSQLLSVNSMQGWPLLSRFTWAQGNIKVKFKVPQKCKAIQIYVSSSDNIIKLKKKVCKKISNLSQDESYKKMIFKYNGKNLNDNHYLLSYLISNRIPIYCEFCNIDEKNICVLKIEGKENFPERIQINRNDKISDLKKIISELVNCEYDKLKLYYDSEELEEDKTIDECKLKDDFKIIARKIQIERAAVNSILPDNKTYIIEYSYDQDVENFKKKLADNLNLDFKKIFLYNDGDLMEEKTFIYEYNLDDNSTIEYYNIISDDKIELVNDDKKDYLIISRQKITKQSILLLQHKVEMEEKRLIYHHSKSENSSLVNITGVYQLNDTMYIAMDDIFSGTIVSYLNNSESNKQDLSRIIMWTKQIISGLKYFHDNGIYFGYLNPLNILIDGNHHVKILAFQIDWNDFLNKDKQKIEINSFMEKEILDYKPDSECDVWSLGAILNYIVTGKASKYKFENNRTGKIRRKHHTEIINKIDPEKNLYDFILCCNKENKNERSTLDQLMVHTLMKTSTL